MLLFQKLADETQMPKPQEYTDTFILTKKLFLVGQRGLQRISNPVERPCKPTIVYPIEPKKESSTDVIPLVMRILKLVKKSVT